MTCKEDINENIKSLNEALFEAADEHLEKQQKLSREFKRSAELEELFKERKRRIQASGTVKRLDGNTNFDKTPDVVEYEDSNFKEAKDAVDLSKE